MAWTKGKTACPLLGTAGVCFFCSLAGPDLNGLRAEGVRCKCQTEIGLRFDYFGKLLVRRGKCKIDSHLAIPNTESESVQEKERKHGEKEEKNKR